MTPIIHIQNLRKTFVSGKATVVAVDDLSLTVHKGEIFGFLGPNGAGKTTTMRMLTTLLKPTSGLVEIADFNLMSEEEKIRTQIGYVSQSGGLERSATARENLILQARIFNFSRREASQRAEELIKALELDSFADRLVSTYSGGQRRRTDLALGMVHRPKILFLDEPTVGLDPISRAHVWDEIKKLRDQGTTIFITTHYLDEADVLCDRVAIMDHGRIVVLGTPSDLKRDIGSDVVLLGMAADVVESLNTEKIFSSLAGLREIIKEKEGLRLLVHHGDALLPQILRLCDRAGIELSGISLHRPTLDDVFLQKTGRSFKQEPEQQN